MQGQTDLTCRGPNKKRLHYFFLITFLKNITVGSIKIIIMKRIVNIDYIVHYHKVLRCYIKKITILRGFLLMM